jgi:hypothetical protein
MALLGVDWSKADRRTISNKIFEYVRSSVTFVQDEDVLTQEFGVRPDNELLIEPAVLLSMDKPRGDCDDFSMLTASLLLVVGLPAYFVTVKADHRQPDRWSHVYVGTVLEDGTEYPLDCSHGPFAGWETNQAINKQRWPVYMPGDIGGNMFGPESDKVTSSPFPGMRGLGSGDYGGEVGSGDSVITGGGGGGTDWGNVIGAVANATQRTVSSLYSPQTANGMYAIRNGQLYQQLPGQGTSLTTLSSGGGMYLILGGIALIGVLAMMGRR